MNIDTMKTNPNQTEVKKSLQSKLVERSRMAQANGKTIMGQSQDQNAAPSPLEYKKRVETSERRKKISTPFKIHSELA